MVVERFLTLSGLENCPDQYLCQYEFDSSWLCLPIILLKTLSGLVLTSVYVPPPLIIKVCIMDKLIFQYILLSFKDLTRNFENNTTFHKSAQNNASGKECEIYASSVFVGFHIELSKKTFTNFPAKWH